MGSNPGSGKSAGIGNSNPLEYSSLKHFMDRGDWQATVHGVAKSQTRLTNWHFHFSCFQTPKTLLSCFYLNPKTNVYEQKSTSLSHAHRRARRPASLGDSDPDSAESLKELCFSIQEAPVHIGIRQWWLTLPEDAVPEMALTPWSLPQTSMSSWAES